MFGIEFHGDDTKIPPTTIELGPQELYKWFQANPEENSTLHIRILCIRIDRFANVNSPDIPFEVPLPADVVEHAIWKPAVYHNLLSNPVGGAAGLLDHPWRFILQTPRDDGPFCSLAMSAHAHFVKGIYMYDDDSFCPTDMSGGEVSLSAWRSSGLQIVTIPHKFVSTHSVHVSQLLARTVARVKSVETTLANDRTLPDFSSLGQILHTCNAELVDIERRSRFEQNIIEAIESIVSNSRHGTIPWPPLAPQKTALASCSFDFESLPRRIANARATISNLIQQRNEQLNLELTQASFRIAEATLSDARSMRTIAIMTIVLLPGTAVASVFSMGMFNWNSEGGDHIASKWLWIYFVVTVPLTVLILGVWWEWNRRSQGRVACRSHVAPRASQSSFTDEEAGHTNSGTKLDEPEQ